MTATAGGADPVALALPLFQTAVEIVANRLHQDDPQLPGWEARAKRIVEDLEEAGVLYHGRRVEALPYSQVARFGL